MHDDLHQKSIRPLRKEHRDSCECVRCLRKRGLRKRNGSKWRHGKRMVRDLMNGRMDPDFSLETYRAAGGKNA
jgi:hypothetical protein